MTQTNEIDVQGPNVADSGKPIFRLAARIDNLKGKGYRIESSRHPNGTSTYRLETEDVVGGIASPAPGAAGADLHSLGRHVGEGPGTPTTLFEVEPVRSVRGHDQEAA